MFTTTPTALLVVLSILAGPVLAVSTDFVPDGEMADSLFLSSSALSVTNVLVYWDPVKSDGTEKNNIINILQDSGCIVTDTTTIDPAILEQELIGKDSFIVAELIDDGMANDTDIEIISERFTAFAPVLNSFLSENRSVIVTEGDASIRPGIEVVNTLGWTSITGNTAAITPVSLTLDMPSERMLEGISSLSTDKGWMGFSSSDPSLNQVAGYGNDMVLAGKFVNGGYFGIIGFDYFLYNQDMALVLCNSITPEPSTLLLFGLGGLILRSRKL